MKNTASLLLVLNMLFFSCDTANQSPSAKGSGSSGSSPEWLIPKGQVLDGGPGKDGIPALENPITSNINEISFLSDDDLVIGYSYNGEYRAYPHNILDWHEIINDDLKGRKLAITYCPLTGTGIGWDSMIQGSETTFGVSGLLYNTNLIPYDRETESNWCQISLNCVNGTLKGSTISTFQLMETTWKTWKMMFPNSSVVNKSTGFSRDYTNYPYGDYRTNDDKLLFPVNPKDGRIPAKERVLALVLDNKAKVYRFDSFENGTQLLVDDYNNRKIVVVGSKEMNFIVAFENKINGKSETFEVENNSDKKIVFSDSSGNKYDLFGKVIEGPDAGLSIQKVTSFMAYWFSIGAFYPNAIIYDN